jgi:hypothetical protein
VALQVAERAVVGDDLEAVAQRLQAAAGTVAAVGALAHEVGQQRAAGVVAEVGDCRAHAVLARVRRLEQQRRQQRILVAVDVHEAHRCAVGLRVVAVEPEPGDPRPRGLLA